MQSRQTSKGMFGRRTTAPTPFWSRDRKIVALSAIFGIIIGLGVTAAAGGAAWRSWQSGVSDVMHTVLAGRCTQGFAIPG